MDDQRTILGAGFVTGAVLIGRAVVTGDNVIKPALGIAIAVLLLAGMDAAGLGAIAAPLALLLAGSVIVMNALPVLNALKGI